MEHTGPKRIPTVSRVIGDTLIELVYDAEHGSTALVVSRFDGLWNVEQEVQIGTEMLVPYAATNNLIASKCVLLPSKPVEYGFKDELIADIRAFLHRYVDLVQSFEEIAAYYVLLSWVYDAFGELPYLRLLGDYGTGKTRALLAIGSLCYKPFFASGASTVSPIFHMLDAFGGTLILDEADMPFSDAKADLVKILNNGTVKGIPVLRTVLTKQREFNPYAFQVFGPKLIAARERFQDHALESRFLTQETGNRPLRADIPIHLPRRFSEEALLLRNRLLHFRLSTYFKIKPDIAALMAGADPRLNQTSLALLSLVDDPSARASLQAYLLAQYALDGQDRADSSEGRVLLAALMVLDASQKPYVAVRDIAQQFNADNAVDQGYVASNRWIGQVLRAKFGVRTRKSGGNYVLATQERERLTVIAARYGLCKSTNTLADQLGDTVPLSTTR